MFAPSLLPTRSINSYTGPHTEIPLSADNADQVRQFRVFGRGYVEAITWAHQTLVVGTSTGIYLYRDLTSEPILFYPSPVKKMSLSPKSRYLIAVKGLVRILTWPDGKLVFTTPGDDAAISADERLLAIAQGEQIHIYRLSDFTEQFTLTGRQFIVFSPTQPELLATGGERNDVRLWNVELRTEVSVLKGTNTIFDLAFSPDGHWLAAGCWGGDVHLWDVTSGQETQTFNAPEWVYAVSFSSDNTLLAYAGDSGQIYIWNIQSESFKTINGPPNRIFGLAFGNSGGLLASGGNGNEVSIWTTGTGQSPSQSRGSLHGYTSLMENSIADKHFVVSIGLDEQTRVWNIETGGLVALGGNDLSISSVKPPFQQKTDTFGLIHLMRPDGQRWGILLPYIGELPQRNAYNLQQSLFAVSEEHTISVHDLETSQSIFSLNMDAENLAFNPDGSLLAAANRNDNSIWLWDVRTQKPLHVFSGHTSMIYAISFDQHSDLMASGGADGVMRLWNVETGTLIKAAPGFYGVRSLAFSPDDSLLVIGEGNGGIRLWNVRTRSQIMALSGHTDSVTDIKFTMEGTRFISTSHDGTIRLWGIAASF